MFAENAQHAAQWGEKFYRGDRFHIITTNVPTDFADQLLRWDKLDGIGAARYVDESQMDEFNRVMDGIRELVGE